MVEHNLAKVGVASSNLVSRSKCLVPITFQCQKNDEHCHIYGNYFNIHCVISDLELDLSNYACANKFILPLAITIIHLIS